METKMTAKDILKDVLNILSGIKVPMTEIETIGIPVGRAINGIQICVGAMERAEQEEAQKRQEKSDAVETGTEETDESETTET